MFLQWKGFGFLLASCLKDCGAFTFVPPSTLCTPPPPPVTEHVSLHSKSLCKNMVRACGGANNMRALSWGAQTEEKMQCC